MAKLSLIESYRNVFRGGSDDAQREAVLADLASFSNFFGVAVSGADLSEANGMRKVYGRILEHINMPAAEVDALIQASRQETIIDSFEGEF